MSDYQKIEIRGEDTPAMNPEQAASIEQETTQEVQAEEVTNERPGWLPEKFETPEAMAFAYKQLEQEFSKSNQPQTEEVAEASGIDPSTFANLSQEFDETGDVSEDSRIKLAQTGIPREFIDEYVEGQKQMAEASIAEVYEKVGGEDQYKSMLNWAMDQMTDNEINLYNDMVAGTKEEMMMAINGLHARYTQSGAGATNAPLMQGETSQAASVGTSYQSREQVTQAMSDPRYKKDPAYREEVYRRLQNSNAI
jgi:hypothetical protein